MERDQCSKIQRLRFKKNDKREQRTTKKEQQQPGRNSYKQKTKQEK